MLELSNVKVDIQGSRILNGISLSVAAGELVCLVGRNGAGKTTTFRSIMGYRRPLSGDITFDGASLTKLPTWRIAQSGIGFSPEESEVYADLTVAENIELSTWTRPGGRSAYQRIEEAYTVFPKLRQYLARGGAQLSGGERKMVSIARALTLDPKLLLLDEPFEGLSPAIIPLIAEGVASIRAMGKGVLMAESNVHHIPDYVDRLYVLERGELMFSGSLAEARRDRDVMRVIAGEVEVTHQPDDRAPSGESKMKHYVGDRTIDGVKVTVDGVPLNPRIEVMEFSKNGFEWSYEGPEPRQLALALLAEHLGDADAVKTAVEPFMREVVANFGNEWEMTSSDIDLALKSLGGSGKAVAQMPLQYRAAILHAAKTPLSVETVTATVLKPTDVLVRIRAAGLCHTDLEVIEGSLRFPMPIVLGHEAAGVVEDVGSDARGVKKGDHVVLSWNPHCGHCFYCDRDLPIVCEEYLGEGPKAKAFDGESRARLADGRDLQQLMFVGSFGEYCIVPDQQAIAVPKEIPLDRACLIGCGVMTGVGAALNLDAIKYGDTVMVIGCGAVGLAAVQGARLAGAGAIIAADLDPAKLALAMTLGATHAVNVSNDDPVAAAKSETSGRGVDVVIESAGSLAAFRVTAEAVRPGGNVIWLGKVDVQQDVAFRWGSLMQEKRIRRVSYGNARPHRDFPMLARAYLDGSLMLDDLISRRISLNEINAGFDALKRGETIRSVVMFD